MEERIKNAYNEQIQLTREQQSCLDYEGNKALVVKGIAGTGKSVVLMSLAKKYIEQYRNSSGNKVAIFTFQNTLVSATKELLEVNGNFGDTIYVGAVNKYTYDLYEAFIQMGIAKRYKHPPKKDKEEKFWRERLIERAVEDYKKDHAPHRLLSAPTSFWCDEFLWMKSMNIFTDNLDDYRRIPRRGRGQSPRIALEDRDVVFGVFVKYCELQKRQSTVDWEDQVLFINRNIGMIPASHKYDYVLVDEAQDLSLAQMMMIKNLGVKNIVIAMDANQRIHGRNWTFKMLGMDTSSKRLSKSMRTTIEIDSLAESVRKHNDLLLSEEDMASRVTPEKHGTIPELVHLKDIEAEKQYVIRLVREYLKNDKLTIGILAAKNSMINEYASWLSDAGIYKEIVTKDDEFHVTRPGVKIATIFGAKGLEFHCVIIPDFMEGNYPYSYYTEDKELYEQYILKMRNLVYVSMTRAKLRLTLTYWGSNGSRFIGEMDPAFYQVVGTPLQYHKAMDMSFSGGLISSSGKASLPPISVPKKMDESSRKSRLVVFFEGKGCEVVDKRDKEGALWVIGTKAELEPVLAEAREKFGVKGSYSDGGRASKNRPGWFTYSRE